MWLIPRLIGEGEAGGGVENFGNLPAVDEKRWGATRRDSCGSPRDRAHGMLHGNVVRSSEPAAGGKKNRRWLPRAVAGLKLRTATKGIFELRRRGAEQSWHSCEKKTLRQNIRTLNFPSTGLSPIEILAGCFLSKKLTARGARPHQPSRAELLHVKKKNLAGGAIRGSEATKRTGGNFAGGTLLLNQNLIRRPVFLYLFVFVVVCVVCLLFGFFFVNCCKFCFGLLCFCNGRWEGKPAEVDAKDGRTYVVVYVVVGFFGDS